ncbi:MAG: ribonuclease HI [Treponema sp.]|nr:ribonuclease HI [Treponema sp.]
MQIYTDGGCSGNPGPGGWAYIIVDSGSIIKEEWGAAEHTTNNRMELLAVISALEFLLESVIAGDIFVFTDSQYVQKGITEWIKNWKARNWKTSGKEPVKNADLWQRLDDLAQKLPVSWHWVRGHAGNIYNEHCDDLTQKAIASIKQ